MGFLIQEIALIIISLIMQNSDLITVSLFLVPAFLLLVQSMLYAFFLNFSKYDFDLRILAVLNKSALSAPSWTKSPEGNKLTTAFYKIGYYFTLVFGTMILSGLTIGSYYAPKLLPNTMLVTSIAWISIIATIILMIITSYLVFVCGRKLSKQAHITMKEKGYE